MELSCAIIVFTVGLVTASPYGYGTKGGASAKAEASAVAGAGAYGGIPITAPSGAGYSGSYAKSSSSSFSSSSASSSASSFSYGGSGAYPASIPGATGCGAGACPSGSGYSPTSSGLPSYGNTNVGSAGTRSTASGNNFNSDNSNQEQRGDLADSQKATDCGSGNCQQPVKPTGYSNRLPSNAFSQANALASTSAVYGSPLRVPDTSDSKCTGGKCLDDTKNNLNGGEKCSSGDCKVQTDSLTPYREKENNCASGNCPSKEDDDISVFKPYDGGKIHFSDEKETSYRPSCTYGNCESNNPKPTHSQSPVSAPESPKCNTPGCNNYGQSSTAISNAAATTYTKPSTQLVAPKEGAPCTTPNCQSGPVGTKPFNGYSPNYNSQSPSVTSDGNPSQCVGGACNYSQTKAPSSTNYLNPVPVPTAIGCTSPNCGNNTPLKPLTNCVGGSCGYNPDSGINKEFNKQPGYHTHHPQNGANYNTPESAGCSPGSSNCPGPISSGQYNPGATPSTYYTPPVLGSPPISSSTYYKPSSYKPPIFPPSGYSGNPNLPSSQSNNAYAAASAAQSNGYNKPGNTGYGSYPTGPAFTSHGTSPTVGYSSAPNSGSYNSPSYGTYPTSGISSPTQNCNTPDCSPVESANIPKPAGVEKEKLPVYHGGFGGPTGILNPNEFNISPPPSIKPGSPPAVPVSRPGCLSGNCQQPNYSGFGGPAGILKPNKLDISSQTHLKPSSSPEESGNKPDCVSGICQQPIHSGFGGPAGVLKPNEFDIPLTPSSKPTLSPIGPVEKPNCESGICQQPIASSSSPSYALGGTNSAQASASAKAVAYTGGFGGPPGILAPYDGGKVDLPLGSKQYSQNPLTKDAGNHDTNSKDGNESYGHNGAQAHSITQTNAVAGGTSGVNPNSSGYNSGGCDGGCNGGNGGASYGTNSAYGLSKSGTADGVHGGLSIASANAKSIAGAGSGGYASSSASAHASSGIKSSYGKR